MAKGKILVVEDEKGLAKLIKYNFEKEGYRVCTAHDGTAGLAAARREDPDLIILDIMMPGMDGLELCKALRKDSDIPIIFLTAKRSEVDRIVGLKLGADDYVSKPFSVGELIARVETVLRRTSGPRGGPSAKLLSAGDIQIDLDRHQTLLKGEPLSLSPKEFKFLTLLMEADGKVISRDELLERIWGYDRAMNLDTRTVDQHIARLRRKLKWEGKRIETVIGTGYRIRRP